LLQDGRDLGLGQPQFARTQRGDLVEEVAAPAVLHADPVVLRVLVAVLDLHDVGVVQLLHDPNFLLVGRLVGDELLVDAFDGPQHLGGLVLHELDHPEPALLQRLDQVLVIVDVLVFLVYAQRLVELHMLQLVLQLFVY